jgi:TPP-dependent trihydroxycyclohexane-1,2-dione (THcHDO) dehydratase
VIGDSGRQGGASFNMFSGIGPNHVQVDWVAHARSLGCGPSGSSIDDLRQRSSAAVRQADLRVAIAHRARCLDRGGAFWQVGVPEVSDRASVDAARARSRRAQRPADRW